jgi:hypothetical protein
MSRLFNLREWLTLPEAARHLSGICGEPVTDADVLRLALDGKLKLSIHFVNQARARRGVVVPREQAESAIYHPLYGPLVKVVADLGLHRDEKRHGRELPAVITEGLRDGSLLHIIHDIHIKEDLFLHLEDKVISINGVWDLPLIAGDRLGVERLFQQLTGGPDVKLIRTVGTFVESIDGQFALLQERYTADESVASRLVKQSPRDYLNGLFTEKRMKKDLEEIKNSKPFNHSDNYFPAPGLPEDGVFVVRTLELAELLSRLSENSAARQPAKESTREKNSLLRIIGLMANQRYAGDMRPYSIASHLVDKAKELGIQIGHDAIANHIKAALELIRGGQS